MLTVAAVLELIVVFGLSVAYGERILFLPFGNASHFHEFHGLGRVLLDRGHQVHVVLGEQDKTIPSRASRSDYHVHIFKTKYSVLMKPEQEAAVFEIKYSLFPLLTASNDVYEKFCEDLLNDKELFDELDHLQFGAIVVDSIPQAHCFVILANKLGNKNVVSLGTPINIWRARLPFVPALMEPRVLLTRYFGWIDLEWQIDDGSFAKRFLNAISHLLFTWRTLPIENDEFLHRHSHFSTYDELYSNTIALYLTNRDHILDVNVFPETTNVKLIGGIANLPPKPLTGKLLEWADGAEEGLVLCSFGSMFPVLTDDIRYKLLKAFSSLSHLRFVVKLDAAAAERTLANVTGARSSTVSNILIVQDLAQNDVLAHRNTKLFISHSGNNGQYEALQNAIPMIAMSIDDEQLSNAMRVVKRGFGLYLDIYTFTVEQLLGAIVQVIGNAQFKARIANASALHRAKPSPGVVAADYVELLLEVGPEALRPTYSYELNQIQFYNWDANLLVCAVIYAWLAVHLAILYKCLFCLAKRCCVRLF